MKYSKKNIGNDVEKRISLNKYKKDISIDEIWHLIAEKENLPEEFIEQNLNKFQNIKTISQTNLEKFQLATMVQNYLDLFNKFWYKKINLSLKILNSLSFG